MLSLGRCLPYQQITQSQHSLSKLMSIEVLLGLHDAASQIETAIEESFIRSHQTQGRCYADFASMRLSRGSRVPHHRLRLLVQRTALPQAGFPAGLG